MEPDAPDRDIESLSVLNAILRHHVRNHLTVIRGRAQWLGRTDARSEDIELIRRHCDELAETVDRIEAITNSLKQTDSGHALDVGEFVETEIKSLRGLYDATFTVSVDVSETTTAVDELFSFVLREMCTNVVSYAGETDPTVTLTVEAAGESIVVTTTSEAATGVPDALSTDPFATTAPSGSTDDYGLFLSEAILTRYGGTIEFDETESGAFRIRAFLPRD